MKSFREKFAVLFDTSLSPPFTRDFQYFATADILLRIDGAEFVGYIKYVTCTCGMSRVSEKNERLSRDIEIDV